MKKLILFLLVHINPNAIFSQVDSTQHNNPNNLGGWYFKKLPLVNCQDFKICIGDSVRYEINIDWEGKCARIVLHTMSNVDTMYSYYRPYWECPASRNINKERLRRELKIKKIITNE
jgi:hypothetical protein